MRWKTKERPVTTVWFAWFPVHCGDEVVWWENVLRTAHYCVDDFFYTYQLFDTEK